MTARMDLRKLGEARDRLADLDRERVAVVDGIIDELVNAGRRRNVKLAAELTGLSRDTLHRRLRERTRTP